jgi:hypothetical protein
MRYFILTAIVFGALRLSGQFSTIQDKDGFVFIRSSPEKGNNIVDTLYNNDLFYHLGFEDDPATAIWYEIDYFKPGKSGGHGFIHKSRVKYLSVFDSIPKVFKDKKRVVLRNDSIQVEINITAFQQNDKSVDLKKAWGGGSGKIPEYQFASIEIKTGGHTIQIPSADIKDLFNFHVENVYAFSDRSAGILYVGLNGADAGSSYEVLWKILGGAYQYRIVEVGF